MRQSACGELELPDRVFADKVEQAPAPLPTVPVLSFNNPLSLFARVEGLLLDNMRRIIIIRRSRRSVQRASVGVCLMHDEFHEV